MNPLLENRSKLSDESFLTKVETDARVAIDQISFDIAHTADYSRMDRLWPSHYLVFATNPLSVAYGACGPALFLSEEFGQPSGDVVSWMQARQLSVDTYPPGLYIGLAGIAYTFHRLGLTDYSQELMSMAYLSPLLYGEPGMFLGAAGWGLASLYFYRETGIDSYLDKAVLAGDYLVQSAQATGDKNYWICNQDGRVHYGFGYGASGIALFLGQLHVVTGILKFRKYCVSGLEFDISNAVNSKTGIQWRRFSNDSMILPYWMHGSAGVGSALIRISRLLDIERYEELAIRIAEENYVKYTFVPGQFEGLAGIAEFMLDISYITGNQKFRQYALDMADTMLWFKIERESGIAFPGRWLSRISHDYATGSAGIGTFFRRLIHPGPRILVDLEGRQALSCMDAPENARGLGR